MLTYDKAVRIKARLHNERCCNVFLNLNIVKTQCTDIQLSLPVAVTFYTNCLKETSDSLATLGLFPPSRQHYIGCVLSLKSTSLIQSCNLFAGTCGLYPQVFI